MEKEENPLILRTKLQRPPVAPDILPRKRLVDRLNEGRHRTLTLISAPAGYGKSTLASRWTGAGDLTSIWVSLEESDSDMRMFLSYVLTAVRSLFPKIDLKTATLLEANPLHAVSVLARYLINDLHAIAEPYILVLDDYHHIHQESPVQDLVAELLEKPPQALHLVLLTRRDPPLPIARLRGRGQVTEIRAADLRFTTGETTEFLSKILRIPIDDETAAMLGQKTEGWVTGLRLAGFYLRDRDDLKEQVRKLGGSLLFIAEYLVEEVLERQDPGIASFLLETSILDRFCAPLCQAVHSGNNGERTEISKFSAQQFIHWLVEANIFVIPLDEEGYWFRYHYLFQSFLQSQLRKKTGADIIAGLHMRAANWLADNSLTEEAILHSLMAGHPETAARFVVDQRHDLMNNAQLIRLCRWLELLPADIVEETPLLASTRAFIGIEQGQDSDVYLYAEKASRMLDRLPPESDEYELLKSEVHILQGFIDMATGRPDAGLTHAEEALNSPFLSPRALLIRSLGLVTKALSLQMQGNMDRSFRTIRKALSDPELPSNIRGRMHFYLAITQFLNGDLPGAESSCEHCLRIVRDLPFTYIRAFAMYMSGAVHYLRNELSEAELPLQNVLDEYRASTPSYISNSGFVMACIYLLQGRAERGLEIVDRIQSYLRENGYTVALEMTRAFQVEYALRRGDMTEARRLNHDIKYDIRPPLWFFYVLQLTPIKLLVAEGTRESLNEAHGRLVAMDEAMRTINRNSVRIDVLALLSIVFSNLGMEADALERLQTALGIAEPAGFIRNFLDLGIPMRNLLERLNPSSPSYSYVRRILKCFETEIRKAPAFISDTEKNSLLPELNSDAMLTKREVELLPLLAEGLGNKEIASQLHIATDTVKTHLQNIYVKLHARGRIEALKRAQALGLIDHF